MLLPDSKVEDIVARRARAVLDEALEAVREIVESVRREGEGAVVRYALLFREIEDGESLYVDRAAMDTALDMLPEDFRSRLERVAARIRLFAERQKSCLHELIVPIPGGAAGHRITPVERVGCYVPAGRYPLVSSLLMTAIPARIAGAGSIWVATPRPSTSMLAAGAIAGIDGVLAVGGAHAIAALAYGCGRLPRSDLVVGPGNAFVTAAKYLVSKDVAIDLLAGPSELAVIADDSADPLLVAADLVAQAEHDPQAWVVLISTDSRLITDVRMQLPELLRRTTGGDIARAALANGAAVKVSDMDEAIAICDRLAPEHVEVHCRDQDKVVRRLSHFGALFLGRGATAVLGDYGAGPNHTLPTGGTARGRAGLSVTTFLRMQTWLEITDLQAAAETLGDAAWLAGVEGLGAHARAAELRLERLRQA
ncbi:MAG: histidinol dehydrogenase [Gemmatimonadales bacterium]|nr:MAG: histidinol dehydrogenase [Gemmatimonadales bacterium]